MYLAPDNSLYPLISFLHSQNLNANKHHFLAFYHKNSNMFPIMVSTIFDNLSN